MQQCLEYALSYKRASFMYVAMIRYTLSYKRASFMYVAMIRYTLSYKRASFMYVAMFRMYIILQKSIICMQQCLDIHYLTKEQNIQVVIYFCLSS